MKPRRWIEKVELKCNDLFHEWLMGKLGFFVYCSGACWSWTPNNLFASDFMEWNVYRDINERLRFDPPTEGWDKEREL